jgi:hypothetical protein
VHHQGIQVAQIHALSLIITDIARIDIVIVQINMMNKTVRIIQKVTSKTLMKISDKTVKSLNLENKTDNKSKMMIAIK